jgi:hypothetical protein
MRRLLGRTGASVVGHSRMSEGTAASGQQRSESGAIIVLALLFLVVVGALVGSLASWATNDLNNTARFASARSVQYAADSATEVAIQDMRYSPLLSAGQTLNASPPTYCWNNPSTPELPSVDGVSMDVWCSTTWNPSSANTRVVTISTCLSNGVSPSSATSVVLAAATACALNPLLQVIVTYDDYPANVISAPTTAQCVVYCGTGMTINSWVWSPVVPTVTGLSTTSGHITGGTSVTITGTGFVGTTGATTVNLIQESGGTPVVGNVIVPGTNVVVNSSTSITFVTPPVISGSAYFVAVTTPGGTNAYSSSDVFTYASVAPTVTGYSTTSPTTGSTAGGTSVTIKGTGFFTGAVVEFVEESGGVQSTPTLEFPATSVAVNSSTQLTAVSPGVTVAGTYFITVTTPTGVASPSTYTSTAGSGTPVFSFSPLVPTVSSITPAVGSTSGNTAVTISGTGFEVGATVTFVQEVAGVATSGSFNATNVTVSGSSTITATAPPAPAGTSYFVTVTIPTGLTAPFSRIPENQ